MPRKPSISPTKLTTYLACPQLFYHTYLNEAGRYYLRSKSYYSFGSSLHAVLQKFHDAKDEGVKSVDQAVSSLEEDWIGAGYSSQQEMQEALSEGKDIIRNYVAAIQAQEPTTTTILVEKQLRMEVGDFDLIGRVDRVDEHNDGLLEVVDYKSGRNSVSEEDIRNDIAMNCYHHLVQNRFPDVPIALSIVALRTNSKATVQLTNNEAGEFLEDVRGLGNSILNKNWEDSEPVEKPLCESCDFRKLCWRQ